jgi:hypothetical protein
MEPRLVIGFLTWEGPEGYSCITGLSSQENIATIHMEP